MPTVSEIRTEWSGIRSALGNLICYMDGKVAQLVDMDKAWQKGYDCGHSDGLKCGLDQGAFNADSRVEDAYDEGYKVGYDDGFNAVNHKNAPTNADKFVEVFGFLPGYEEYTEADGKRVYYPSLNESFWNAEYEEREDE